MPARYPLRETPSRSYPERTRRNVADADATLILTCGPPTGGTALTAVLAERLAKPLLVVDLSAKPDAAAVRDWLIQTGTQVLNVAGPRESSAPGIHALARAFLDAVLGD